MKSTPTKFILLAASLASMLLSASAGAQDFGLPSILLQQSESFRNSDSQIVIRIRNFGDRDAVCGSGFNGSRSGLSDGFDFPRPGGSGDEFLRASRSNSFDFPRPGGSSLSSFQLPNGSKNPDIIGCVDTQRNILFINIIRPQVKEQSLPPVQSPLREPQPTPPILQPQPASPLNQTPVYDRNNSTGFPSSYPVIK